MKSHAFSRSLLTVIVVLVTAMLLSSCLNSGTPTMSTSKQDMMIKENPNAKHAYRIEMRIDNAPGPFGIIEGAAQYDVQNYEDCGEINKVAGTISRITVSPEITWKPKGGGVYEATVHSDRMLDEDYFGRGVCHWGLTEVRAALLATGAKGETRFAPSIVAEDIFSGKAVTLHYVGLRYPKEEMYEDYVDFGATDPNSFKPEFQKEVFTISLMPKDD